MKWIMVILLRAVQINGGIFRDLLWVIICNSNQQHSVERSVVETSPLIKEIIFGAFFHSISILGILVRMAVYLFGHIRIQSPYYFRYSSI